MQEHIYLLLNKPCGYVCSTVSDRSQVVFSLIPQSLLEKCRQNKLNLHTVGRLDKETSGLLLLTTDGMFSHKLTVPQNHVSKTYIATLRDNVIPEQQHQYCRAFKKGVLLPADKKFPQQQSLPAKLKWLSSNLAQLQITEGKFHQVRRMFSAMQNQVVALKRTAIAKLVLPQNLPEGQFIHLTDSDFELLGRKRES